MASKSTTAQQFSTLFEESKGKRTVTYDELIDYYTRLDKRYRTISLQEVGKTDTDYPLHVVYYSYDGNFDIREWKKQGKLIVVINNGIHPGEPDGIDASMMLLRDAAMGKITIPANVALAVIPVLNIGGMLNRGSYSRANQNGPDEYGFRGNAQNLDLNRDFVKMDARETRSFVGLFHKLDPDLFIDNHVSNGADYQHIMTLLTTQHSKLGGVMGKYLNEQLEPMVYANMKQRGYDLVPYVNHWGQAPETGWEAFLEVPRFTSGFAALFQTYGFVPETHMLKPYEQRVWSAYELMRSFIKVGAENAEAIQQTRRQDRRAIQKQEKFAIEWVVDTAKHSTIPFKGYKVGHKASKVSGQPRLYYDRSKPYDTEVKYYNTFKAKQTVTAPEAYIIPQGWQKAIARLKTNKVKMYKLEADSMMEVAVYYIKDYKTGPRPYEGHYLHTNVKVEKKTMQVQLRTGDYIVPLQQKAKRYLIEVLEPTAPDALLAWGFFDAALQQKEHFSDYVFEDEAADILKNNAALKKELKAKQKADTAFAKDAEAQLEFVYRNSPYYEPEHMRYPVFRIEAPSRPSPKGKE